MEKAFDVKDLEDRLKGKGLVVVEDLAKVVVLEVLDWVKESAALEVANGKPLMALIPAVIEGVKPVIMEQVDKIDGQVG